MTRLSFRVWAWCAVLATLQPIAPVWAQTPGPVAPAAPISLSAPPGPDAPPKKRPAREPGKTPRTTAPVADQPKAPDAPAPAAPASPAAAAPPSAPPAPDADGRAALTGPIPSQEAVPTPPFAVPAQPGATPPPDVTTNLIRILVQNGVLGQQQADELLAQARAEVEAHAAPTSPVAPVPVPAPKPVAPGAVRVTYVPDTVRRQLAAEVKQQILQQAHDEGWAEPNVIPTWADRITFYGDIRARAEWDMFPRGNYNLFPDFNAINTSSNGFDSNGTTPPPVLNTTQGRMLPRLRARLGVTARVADWITADVRIATGGDSSPVSTNQTLGAPGDFSKYALWLDLANIRMEPTSFLSATTGRMPNPFWTSNLMFDDDLNFDGFALQAHMGDPEQLSGFLNLGGFPVFNTAFNLGSTNAAKTSSHDAWLMAVQGGGEWRFAESWAARAGLGYFAFTNVSGKTSSPCVAPTSFGSCSTDVTRTPFEQFGNTMIAIRNISTATGTTTAQPQYYGLASRFDVMDFHWRLAYYGYHPIDIALDGDLVTNLGFDKSAISKRLPVNNLGPGSTASASGSYKGSGEGAMLNLTIGHPKMTARGDWNVSLAYKYVGTDAVLDALTDARFHLGGTNAKGFVMSANLAMDKDVWLGWRWYSTNEIVGPPYQVDTILLDLNAKF